MQLPSYLDKMRQYFDDAPFGCGPIIGRTFCDFYGRFFFSTSQFEQWIFLSILCFKGEESSSLCSGVTTSGSFVRWLLFSEISCR